MYIERHVQMKLRRLYSIEYIQDLHDLRPKSDSIMRSRLSTVRQSRNCRVLKSKRYSRVRLSPKMVSSRPSSVTANFEDTFNAFRNYDEPITSDLQDHLLKCTLPDSQPTSSVLLMLDGSRASYKTKTDLAETPLAERFIHQHTLHKSHTTLVVNQVKGLLSLHRRCSFLDVSFRETLARSDWNPASFIRWLQDANLIDWIDQHGGTPLTALLKSRRGEDQQMMLGKMFPDSLSG
jgi:hypothetical protein